MKDKSQTIVRDFLKSSCDPSFKDGILRFTLVHLKMLPNQR